MYGMKWADGRIDVTNVMGGAAKALRLKTEDNQYGLSFFVFVSTLCHNASMLNRIEVILPSPYFVLPSLGSQKAASVYVARTCFPYCKRLRYRW